MKIQIGTYVLIDGQLDSVEEFSAGGEDVVQIVQIARALTAAAINRGNTTFTMQFQKTRDHGSFLAAEDFIFSHHAAIPRSGDILVTTEGLHGVTSQWLISDATCHSRQVRAHIGTTTIWQYRITGGSVSLISSGADTETSYFPDLPLTVKKGIITLAIGDLAKEVVFGTAFDSNPQVYPIIIPPIGQPAIGCWLDGEATSERFKIKTDAAIPAEGYKLSWIAFV